MQSMSVREFNPCSKSSDWESNLLVFENTDPQMHCKNCRLFMTVKGGFRFKNNGIGVQYSN
jgi:hypothetical protein